MKSGSILSSLQTKLKSQMPKIKRQVKKYEAAIANGTALINAKSAPQFNE